VSQRSKRRAGGHGGAAPDARTGRERTPGSPGEARQPAGAPPGAAHSARQPDAAARAGWSLGVQLAFTLGVMAVVTVIAELAGAANLGVALGVGQVAFAIAVIYVLVRR
jgi:hypothetical protein